jgi:hypothetical protein
MPIFNREKSPVPRWRIRDRIPLCPPAPPPCTIFTRPGRQIKVIMDNENIGGSDVKIPEKKSDAFTGAVHEILRLEQNNLLAGQTGRSSIPPCILEVLMVSPRVPAK